MSDVEKWLNPDDATTDAALKKALAAALGAFENLGTEPDSGDVMIAALKAFSGAKRAIDAESKIFKEMHTDRKCHGIYADVRHIVLSAFNARDCSPDEVHPYSVGGAAWEGIISACIALKAMSDLETATDLASLEQWGEDLGDDVLARITKPSI